MNRTATNLLVITLLLLALLSACSPPEWSGGGMQAAVYDPVTAAPSHTPTITPTFTITPTEAPTETPTITPSPTLDTRPLPEQWSSWPVVPEISHRTRDIYRQGLAMGNNPRAYTVVGDCQSVPEVFLGIYATDRYWLGDEYAYLQETIDYFAGSFDHVSAAVRDGLSAPSALSPTWADQTMCESGESPVACELRRTRPSIVFINLGTNWRADASAEAYGKYLRQIVEEVIAAGAVPVLSTKADNVEGDHSINLMTARVAYEYDIPLMNVWLAVQDLPNGGLDAERDDLYLTVDAWDRRSFTALRALDALRLALQDLEPLTP